MGLYSATKNATVSTETSGGTVAWTNPNLAAVQDGFPATITLNAGEDGFPLNCIVGAFSFPPLTTLTGVLCEIRSQVDIFESVEFNPNYLSLNEIPGGSNVVCPSIQTSYTWVKIGGDGIMWGYSESALASLVKSKFFGFQVRPIEYAASGPTTLSVDGMRVTVFYDVATQRGHNILGCGR